MSLITYNGVELFTGQPVPLVSKTSSFEGAGDPRSLIVDTISLRGELTGCGRDVLRAERASALSVFSTNFKNLHIEGVGILTGVKVNSFIFDQAPYLDTLPYTIEFQHYPSGGFEVCHGVAEPTNQFSYVENEDQTLDISQSISARGVNTDFGTLGGNALDNAKKFVTGQLNGIWEVPRPYVISTSGTEMKTYLTNFSETINKTSNTVSVSRSFRTDLSDVSGHVILRYSEAISENINEDILISYNGVIDAGRNEIITETGVIAYSAGGLGLIRDKYQQFKESIDTPFFFGESVTEDTGVNRLTFSLSHVSGDSEPPIVDDFSITVEESSDSSLFNTSINGNISAKVGCVGAKFDDVSGSYNGDQHKFEICDLVYNDFYTTAHGSFQAKPNSVFLHDLPLNSSVTYNQLNETLSYNASYNDRTTLHWYNSGVPTINYNMTFQPSLQVIKSVPSVSNGGWVFEDLGYRNRANFSISMSANSGIPSGSFEDFAKFQFNKMTTSPTSPLLETHTYQKNNIDAVNATWARSFHSTYSVLDIGTNYTGVDEFRV